MGHTNSTANLSLPQFIGTDKPTWLGDVNGAFLAIDGYVGTNDAAVAAAASDASSAISQASAAVNTANTANTTAGNASTAANNAVGVANTANAIAGTVDAKVGLLADLNTTDRTSIVNAINEINGTVVATAAANQTFAAQLADVESAFSNLTAEQKIRAKIKSGNSVFASCLTGSGTFTVSRSEASSAYISTIDLTNHTFYAATITTGSTSFADNSAHTNSDALVLYI